MEEIIMVGIDNTDNRTAEYSPAHKGKSYSDFLVNTVKPFIDSKYRTLGGREHTSVLGSSMGGIISFHLIWEYPQVFSKAGCFSPAFVVDDDEIVTRVRKGHFPKDIKIAIVNGTVGLESKLQPAIDRMMTTLNSRTKDLDDHVFYKIYEGAEHNEPAWAKQAPEILLYLFGSAGNSQ